MGLRTVAENGPSATRQRRRLGIANGPGVDILANSSECARTRSGGGSRLSAIRPFRLMIAGAFAPSLSESTTAMRFLRLLVVFCFLPGAGPVSAAPYFTVPFLPVSEYR